MIKITTSYSYLKLLLNASSNLNTLTTPSAQAACKKEKVKLKIKKQQSSLQLKILKQIISQLNSPVAKFSPLDEKHSPVTASPWPFKVFTSNG